MIAHYKGPRPEALWNDPRFAENYTHYTRLQVHLQADAIQAMIKGARGAHSPNPLYLLVKFEGDLRRDPGGRDLAPEDMDQESVSWTRNFVWALSFALEEFLFIYNFRTKKAMRPAWHAKIAVEDRTLKSMMLMPVHCIIPSHYYAHMEKNIQRLLHLDEFCQPEETKRYYETTKPDNRY